MKSNYFFCYNRNLATYLKESGADQITLAQDPVTKKVFSLFKIDSNFQNHIDEYKALQSGMKYTQK